MKQISLKKNFVMNVILTVTTFIFPLITFPYISRILHADGMGKVSFATSIVTYFNMFAQLGIPTYGIKICAGYREDKVKLTKTVQELMVINLITTILSYTGLFICLTFVQKLQNDKVLLLIVSSTIILNTIGMEWLYKAMEQYTYITIRSIAFKIIALLFTFVLIHSSEDYIIYGAISIFAASASNILNFINARNIISFKPLKNLNIRQHLTKVLVFFAMSCATTVYTNLDTVMLGFMTSDVDVGYYNAAVKIKAILVSIVTSLGTVLLPRSSFYVKNKMIEEFKKITFKAIGFVCVCATPLFIYFMLFAPEGIRFLSGSGYDGSIAPMRLIMPTLLLIGLSNIIGVQVLIPLGKEKIVLYSEVGGALTDLIANMLLIPQYTASGAAIGTLLAEFVVLLIQYIAMRKELKEMFRAISCWKIVVAVVAASAIAVCIKIMKFNSFVSLICSGTLFFSVYILVLLIIKERFTLEMTNQIITKAKQMYNRN